MYVSYIKNLYENPVKINRQMLCLSLYCINKILLEKSKRIDLPHDDWCLELKFYTSIKIMRHLGLSRSGLFFLSGLCFGGFLSINLEKIYHKTIVFLHHTPLLSPEILDQLSNFKLASSHPRLYPTVVSGSEEENLDKNQKIGGVHYETKSDYGMYTKNGGGQNQNGNKTRILCWVMTWPKNHGTKAKAVKATWGQRCDKLLFMSKEEDKELGTVALPNLPSLEQRWRWRMFIEAALYVWHNHRDDADWFLRSDDDSYIIMENLRQVLGNLDHNQPIHVGVTMGGDPLSKLGFHYGGPGIALSRKTLEMMIQELFTNETICPVSTYKHQPPGYRGDDDVELARCFRKHGGFIKIDPKDRHGRRRFMPEGPEVHAEKQNLPGTQVDGSSWIDTAISFHHIQESQIYMLEYLLYHVKLN